MSTLYGRLSGDHLAYMISFNLITSLYEKISLISSMRKQVQRGYRSWAQGHTDSKQRSWNSDPISVIPKLRS